MLLERPGIYNKIGILKSLIFCNFFLEKISSIEFLVIFVLRKQTLDNYQLRLFN